MKKIHRLRIFAGPNGSGKTSVLYNLLNEKNVNLGVYVNADDIEKKLKTGLNFSDYTINVQALEIQKYIQASNFSPIKRKEPDLWQKVQCKNNILSINTYADSYLAADIAEFIRQKLLELRCSFTFETVMSNASKIDFLKKAASMKYRIYLYYISTEDPEINISRVKVRVSQNGHEVPDNLVRERYEKSMNNLKEAIKYTYRTFLFDNSGSKVRFIAEIFKGNEVLLADKENIPLWIEKYVFN